MAAEAANPSSPAGQADTASAPPARLRIVAGDATAAPEGRCPQTAGGLKGGAPMHLHPAQKKSGQEKGSQSPKKISQKKSAASPDAPRKRGRPPGLGKVPGSGRKKGSANWNNERVREHFVEHGLFEKLTDIIGGRQVLTTGPTGKEVYARASLELQAKTAAAVFAKCWPDFQVIDQTTRTEDAEPRDPRDLARAIIASLRQGVADGDDDSNDISSRVFVPASAESDDVEPWAPSASRARAGGAQGHLPVPELDSTAASLGGRRAGAAEQLRRSTAAPDAEVGDYEQVGPNGATIVLTRIAGDGRQRWNVLDGAGVDFGGHWSRDEARARAEVLVEQRRI